MAAYLFCYIVSLRCVCHIAWRCTGELKSGPEGMREWRDKDASPTCPARSGSPPIRTRDSKRPTATAGVVCPCPWLVPDAGPPYCRGVEFQPGEARAVNDAVALIERGERATALAVNPADFTDRHQAPPIEWMIEHLRRHDASVDVAPLESIPERSIGDTLQTEACALGADLIVAAAFGHPKQWEKL
jgi:nucleotide-binding universal stress UspA family protein